MIKIISYITNHIKIQDIIIGSYTSGSYADYLMLKESYRNKNRPKKDKKSKFKQMLFNTKFLQNMLEKYGELHCEYCGKPDLILYHHSIRLHSQIEFH